MMEGYIGENEKKLIEELILDEKSWEDPKIIRLKINLLEQMMINGVMEAEKEYFRKYNKSNLYYHRILKKYD